MSALKLPFPVVRASEDFPVTTGSEIDIAEIEGLNASDVQKALEELLSKTIAATDKRVFCSLSAYKALLAAGQVDPDTYYMITNVNEDAEGESV